MAFYGKAVAIKTEKMDQGSKNKLALFAQLSLTVWK